MATLTTFSTSTVTIISPLRSRANPSLSSPNFIFFNPSNPPTPSKAIKLCRSTSSSSTTWFGNSSRRITSNPEAVRSSGTWVLRQFGVSCLGSDEFEPEPSSASLPGATIDTKLPRRSLLVQFTCNACGNRTERLVNRLAYERGTIFVQCAGCLKHHRLVDNLGLVVEYDFREDVSTDLNMEQE